MNRCFYISVSIMIFFLGAGFGFLFSVKISPREEGYQKLLKIESNEINESDVTLEEVVADALRGTGVKSIFSNDGLKDLRSKRCKIGSSPLLYQLEGIADVFESDFVIVDGRTVYFRER